MRDSVQLHWIPLGAGDGSHCVRWSGRAFERLVAGHQHRPPCDLHHSALVVRSDDVRFTIEMAPEWTGSGERGVVCGGPVGLRALRRSRWFRYEIRRWQDGNIPDLADETDPPIDVATDAQRTRNLLELVVAFPTATWGRDELAAGEMWNSNSLVSWLLLSNGHDVAEIRFPAGGRAPGWDAGLVVAGRRAEAPIPQSDVSRVRT